MFLELGPTRKTIFAGDDELRIVKTEFTRGRMLGLHAMNSIGLTVDKFFEEIFGLMLELFKTRPDGQGLRHITFLLSPVVRGRQQQGCC